MRFWHIKERKVKMSTKRSIDVGHIKKQKSALPSHSKTIIQSRVQLTDIDIKAIALGFITPILPHPVRKCTALDAMINCTYFHRQRQRDRQRERNGKFIAPTARQ